MAQDIELMNALYLSVPAILLPKSGGGMAAFTDVSDTTATAGDVAAGTYFYTAAGVRTQGTGSGGGQFVTNWLWRDTNGVVRFSATDPSEEPTYAESIIVYVPASSAAIVGTAIVGQAIVG